MKQFSFEVSVHPKHNSDGQPSGSYSVLFTPSVIDTESETLAEDILLRQIDRRQFLDITAECTKHEEALKVAHDFDDLMTIYSMDEDDIQELAHCIRLAALKCAVTKK